jgi:hypothetical protein
LFFTVLFLLVVFRWSADGELRDEEGLGLGLVAAAKKEQTEEHAAKVAPILLA